VSDCRRPDVMYQVAIASSAPGSMPCVTTPCDSIRTSSGGGRAGAAVTAPAPAAREPLSTGRIEVALGHTRIASVCGVPAVST
jgi:hypothetical protein